MTKRLDAQSSPPPETDRAAAACSDYLRLGPTRSMAKLAAHYDTQPPEARPTRRLETLKAWSHDYDWGGRARAYDLEQEMVRRSALHEATRKDASKQAQHLLDMANAGIVMVRAAMNDYVDFKTARLLKEIPAKEIAPLMRACTEVAQLASGQATSRTESLPMDAKTWHDALAKADPEARMVMLKGLRAARQSMGTPVPDTAATEE